MPALCSEDTRCDLCASRIEASSVEYRDNRFGLHGTFRIGWCRGCGLGVTLDPPTADELAALYAATYVDEEVERQVPRAGAVARAWHRLNGSLAVADLPLAEPILDIGSNTGEALLALRQRGLKGIGLEPNPAAAAIARSAGLEVIEASVETAELPDGRFGSVLASQVLEHVHDPVAVLSRLHRALRPGGTLVVVLPNTGSAYRSLFGTAWIHWHVPFHLTHHTERSLRLLLEQTGFHIRRLRTRTPGEGVLLSLAALRNARSGKFRVEHFSGRYGARALVAPTSRFFDALGRGDAFVAEAVAHV